MIRKALALAIVIAWTIVAPAAAQSVLEGRFDPAVPTLEQVVGHRTGAQVTAPDEIVRYLDALHRAAPDRTRLVEYARSWEGRPLYYLVISSAANMARADANRESMARFAAGEAAPTAGVLPVTWLSFGVHGDEISSSDAALALAYHLLAASGDAETDRILRASYVVIDPSQNPDGRARFVQSFRAGLGIEPNGDRYSAEHDQPWPGGRVNHYLFDLNRDWFAQTQPETRGKVAAVNDWHPVVYVDAHEMGGDDSYFFPPSADPFNPNITAGQRAKQVLLGRAIAQRFDERGIPYFTREVYDAFYPGYGDTWPTLTGAIGVTFEQASARGLVWDRSDKQTLTYADGVRNHFLATLAYADTVAQNAASFVADYAAFRRAAAAEKPGGSYLIDLSQHRYNAEALGRRLAGQGIAVERLDGAFSACGRTYPAGALAVPRGQPAGKLVRSLLDRDTALDPAFVKRQEDRRSRTLPHEIYDTTGWSVGLMSGVEVALCGSPGRSGPALAADAPIDSRADAPGNYGLAVPWTDGGQARLVLAASRAGVTGRASDQPFVMAGRTFPRGSVIFARGDNPPEAIDKLGQLAREIGAETVALDESWVESGPNVGSTSFVRLAAPKVALAWGDGVSPTDAGALRYVIERRLATPVVPIRTRTLPSARLTDYDVLIVPDARLDDSTRKAVKAFAQGGGTVLVIGSSIPGFAKGDSALFATKVEAALGAKPEEASDDKKDDDGNAVAGTEIASLSDYRTTIGDPARLPDALPGALLNTVADTDSFLSSGYDGGAVVNADGDLVLRPLNAADGTNVLRFAGADALVASGYVWDENRRQMAFKPYMMAQRVGDGMAIGFASNPAQRGYLDGLDLLIANAILFTPARLR